MLRTLLLLLISFPVLLCAQKVTGVITNQNGDPIQYATLYIEELQTGTSANHNGEFILHLAPGKYTLDVRSMGYTPGREIINMDTSDLVINVELSYQSYILAGVTVRADNEDPAYSIMRKAIARAPGFVNQMQSYTSEVYIKGSLKLDNIPRIIAKQMAVNGERPKEGQTYVNESINKITFEAPDKYNQEVISVNNSFPMDENDVPVIGLISGSIYQSQDDFYISPFAANSFSHYKFEYEGLLQDGASFINKIKVTPKRKSKLLMEGYLYIVDELWCLYSYDINLNPAFTEIQFKQFYAPVKGNNYLPVNYFIDAKFSAMGVRGTGTYTSTIKYSDVVLNPQFTQKKIQADFNWNDTISVDTTLPPVDPKVVEIEKKLDVLLASNNPSNRDMMQMQRLMAKKAAILEDEGKENPLLIESNYSQVVSKDALERDSLYWESIRPVPASEDEKISYKQREEAEAKEDSTSTFMKALKIAGFGNYEWERSRTHYMYYPGIIALRNVGFNPVDGWKAMQSFKYRWNIDTVHVFEMKGMGGYAIDRAAFFGSTQMNYAYLPKQRGVIELRAGIGSRDYNKKEGTPEGVNAFYNILAKENFIKFYHDTYVDLYHGIDIVHGFRAHFNAQWNQTDTLNNNTKFSLYKPEDVYEKNVPSNDAISAVNLDPMEQMIFKIGLEYTPKVPYEIRKGNKNNRRSKYPTIKANYTVGVPLNDTYAKFHKIDVGVDHFIDFYSISSLEYQLNAGMYSRDPKLHFSSFQHFRTIQEPLTTRGFKNSSFFLMNNYEYSTAKKYFEAHIKYSTQFLLLKRLPIISNQFWTENVYLNALTVEGMDPYVEVGYSLGQILFAGEIGVFAAFKGDNFHGVGVRAAFVLD